MLCEENIKWAGDGKKEEKLLSSRSCTFIPHLIFLLLLFQVCAALSEPLQFFNWFGCLVPYLVVLCCHSHERLPWFHHSWRSLFSPKEAVLCHRRKTRASPWENYMQATDALGTSGYTISLMWPVSLL